MGFDSDMTPLFLLALMSQGDVRVPAFTAYLEPNPDAFEVEGRDAYSEWTDPSTHVLWFGKLRQAGDLSVKVHFAKAEGLYKLELDGKTHTAKVGEGGIADFGRFQISKAGYKRFKLVALGTKGSAQGVPEELLLSGTASEGSHFNLVPRRNAASVHLGYPTEQGAKIVKFYNEIVASEEPVYTYYMACGFHRGYFGMQVNGPKERRVIFSIWDAGNEAVDRNKVATDNRVRLLAKGPNVVAGDFGNEGTGGHSHLVYNWKKGDTYRFLVTVKPEGTTTTYSGYFYFPEKKSWGLIATFRAPKDGSYLGGLYSFNENFGGSNGHLQRKAEFRNQWIQTEDGKWTELTKARFTHDATGRKDRKDYAAGPVRNGFFLSNGGYIDNGVKLGDSFNRKQGGKKPTDLLPEPSRR